MSVTVVLDSAGLEAWARRVPPRPLLAVMEVLRREGAGRVLVPSVVTVEALTGGPRDAELNHVLKQVDVDERLPLTRTRRAAALRQGTAGSAVDAVVAEAAISSAASYVVTSDPTDLLALLEGGGGSSQVVVV
jgi:hypothetical protein